MSKLLKIVRVGDPNSDKSSEKYKYAIIFYSKYITPKDKKYSVITPQHKLIHFGDAKYEQFHDKIGLYEDLDHFNDLRRKLYRFRHKNDNYNDPEYPGYYSWRFLW